MELIVAGVLAYSFVGICVFQSILREINLNLDTKRSTKIKLSILAVLCGVISLISWIIIGIKECVDVKSTSIYYFKNKLVKWIRK